MSAYFESGFCVRTPSWHREETLLADWPESWDDARKLAGLDWEPRIVPMWQRMPDDTYREVEHARLVERDDTLAVLGRGVSKDFSLVSHAQMGEILEAIVGQPNVKFETAGSVRGGAHVYALVYLDEPVVVAGDDTATLPFVVLLNSHDGSGACKVVSTDVRVVCWNTYEAASLQGERSGRQFVFRHAGDVSSRIEEAKQALKGVRDGHEEWVRLAGELNLLRVDDDALDRFVHEFIPEPPAGTFSERVAANIDRDRRLFRSLYLDSPTTEGHRGTALGVVDAAVEYLDHVRGYRDRDTYLGRTLLRPEPLKARAVRLIRRAA